jgi:hypothetical protein
VVVAVLLMAAMELLAVQVAAVRLALAARRQAVRVQRVKVTMAEQIAGFQLRRVILVAVAAVLEPLDKMLLVILKLETVELEQHL